MHGTEDKHELSEFHRRIDEIEGRINDYLAEEKQWMERERHLLELIEDRENEIQLLKAIIGRIYYND
jgi:hypothetical protein